MFTYHRFLQTLVHRLRRRGARAALHYSAGGSELRATPQSATRANAARFLAVTLGVPTTEVTVLANETAEPDGDRTSLLEGAFTTVFVGSKPAMPGAEPVCPPGAPSAECAAVRSGEERDRMEDDIKADAAVVASRLVRLNSKARGGAGSAAAHDMADVLLRFPFLRFADCEEKLTHVHFSPIMLASRRHCRRTSRHA